MKLILALVAMIVGATSLRAAPPPPPTPTSFSAYLGGFLGPSEQIELHGGTLSFTASGGHYRHPIQMSITPTAAQWLKFRQALDALNVWRWRKNYPNNGAQDGTQWSLSIAYPDHKITTRGDNNFPNADGKPNGNPEATKTFEDFKDAVKKLTGGKAFR